MCLVTILSFAGLSLWVPYSRSIIYTRLIQVMAA